MQVLCWPPTAYNLITTVWKCSTITSDIKLRLYSPIVVPTGIYASKTWKTTNKINKMIDVFHRRCLRSIWGISWCDHITNDEVTARTGQAALHDTVATRRRRFVGHILRLPTTRPANLAIIWRPEGGRRRVGRPKRTWQERKIWTHGVLIGLMREILPTTVPDGDNSSPNVLIRTAGTKSK